MLYPLSYGGSRALVAAAAYNTGRVRPCRYGCRVTVVMTAVLDIAADPRTM